MPTPNSENSPLFTRQFRAPSKGSKTAVIATQRPIPSFPRGDGTYIPEILLMRGLELPEDRKIPLLDAHNRTSIDAVKGSIVNLRIEKGELVGELEFDDGETNAQRKVERGHVDKMRAQAIESQSMSLLKQAEHGSLIGTRKRKTTSGSSSMTSPQLMRQSRNIVKTMRTATAKTMKSVIATRRGKIEKLLPRTARLSMAEPRRPGQFARVSRSRVRLLWRPAGASTKGV